jgi:hypothetical protein
MVEVYLQGGDIQFDVEVAERASWADDGCDTMILRMETGQVLALDKLMIFARVRAEECAARLGVRFRRGSFVLTSDPATVLRWGVMPEHADCNECRDGAAGAALILEEDSRAVVLVGQLFWGYPQPNETSSGST